MTDKILLINNSFSGHYEILESIIINYTKIIDNNDKCKIYLNLSKKNSELQNQFCKYITEKYQDITIENIKTYDYFIEGTLHPSEYKCVKNNNKYKYFYISHIVDKGVFNNAKNIFYLTPLSNYNVFKADVLPFNNYDKIEEILCNNILGISFDIIYYIL